DAVPRDVDSDGPRRADHDGERLRSGLAGARPALRSARLGDGDAAMSVAGERLRAQRLVGEPFATAADVARTLMAVQAQDLRAALWALAMRTRDETETSVEAALGRRELVRTWPMRGTLHFVAPEDARWMVALLAPPVLARAATRYRQLGL